MGFPWKKGKSTTRISQMVKDQFHHRKNAASPLVVETGFPTSLVDLIVNHRDRFKNPSPSPRYRKRKPPPPPLRTGDPLPTPPSQSSIPPPAPFPTPLPPTSPLLLPPTSPIPREIDDVGIRGDGEFSGENVEKGANSNKVFLAVLKIFLLVVLAFGAKKFAVGITMSAFLLFFLDYLARNVFKCKYLVPCSQLQEKKLRLMVLEVWRFIISRVFRLDEEVAVYKAPRLKDDDSNYSIEEIEIVQPPIEMVSYGKEEIDDLSHCGRNGKPEGTKSMAELIEEDEEMCELSESKRRKSRKAKIKSRMKKLLPKKIGNSRKTGKDLMVEINPTGQAKLSNVEGNGDTEYHENGLEPDNMATSTAHDPKHDSGAIISSPELSEDMRETTVVCNSDLVEREKNCVFMFLVLVALVGLVMGGRVYALLFTLTWCFVSKSGEAIRRCIKFS